jgi:hypothetical protein
MWSGVAIVVGYHRGAVIRVPDAAQFSGDLRLPFGRFHELISCGSPGPLDTGGPINA